MIKGGKGGIMKITVSRAQAMSTITSYTYNNSKSRIKQSISLALENLTLVFSKNQNQRIKSLEIAVFNILLIGMQVIAGPLLLALQIFIATYRPKKLVPFERAKELLRKDPIAHKAFILFYNHIEQCIKPYQAHALQQRDKYCKSRIKLSCFTVIAVLSEPLASAAYTISLSTLGVFHLVGALFSKKCSIEKGLYLFIPIQLHLPKAVIKLLFSPINIVGELRKN